MISILTPTYNHGQFLEDAIASVQEQTGEFEHIVVDGASSDRTQQVLDSWGSRIVALSEPDDGQSDALNKALDLAHGDVVGWLNADEFYMPGVFSAIQTEFDSNPALDVIVGDSILIDTQSRALRLYASQPLSPPALKWYDCYILTSGLFVRRSAISGFRWDTSLQVCMDWDLLLYLLTKGSRFKSVKYQIGAFRVYPEQASARLAARRDAEYEQLAAKYGISTAAPRLRRMVGRADRILRKVTSGAFSREARFLVNGRNGAVRWMQ